MHRPTTAGRAAQTVLALVTLLGVAPVRAQQPVPPPAPVPKWEYRLTPYLWGAGLDGRVGAAGRTAGIDLSFDEACEDLDFAAMLTFEARRGPILFMLDLFYLDLSDDAETPGDLFSGGKLTTQTLAIDFAFGRRVVQNPKGSVDVLIGLRYWDLTNDVDLEAGTLPAVELRDSQDWFDPVVGATWRPILSSKLHGTLKFDIGGFGLGSDFTWQIFAGLNYALSKKGSLIFGYRHLDVDYNDDGFVYDVATSGPLLGYQFKF